MKTVMITLIATLGLAITAAAGPFGLSKGMKPSELGIKTNQLKVVTGNLMVAVVTKVPKPHSRFEEYRLVFAKTGLSEVVGQAVIQTSQYGEAAIAAFNEIEPVLIAKYGPGDKFDYVNSIWNKPQDWTLSLTLKERRLAAYWPKENAVDKSALDRDLLDSICLEVKGVDDKTVLLQISYEFKGWEKDIDDAKSENNRAL